MIMVILVTIKNIKNDINNEKFLKNLTYQVLLSSVS